MPLISWAQRRTGKALGSNAVVADGTQTLLCTYLSAVLLVGLVLNATLGWGWADPLAGLIIPASPPEKASRLGRARAAARQLSQLAPTPRSLAALPAAPTPARTAESRDRFWRVA
jgi:hypothetical protein